MVGLDFNKIAMESCQQSDFQVVLVADGDGDDNETLPSGIAVSKFDYSVENHFKVVDKISMISGESEFEYEQSEVQLLASSVTFLRKWRDFCYQPRAIRFACESDTPREKDVTAWMNLPQFSSAAVPKDMSDGNDISSLSKDFVMYVGGPIWALDWCPGVHKKPDSDTNVEYIAVSAHPPESSYHKIGAPLTGRGLIQIWCLLNAGEKDQDVLPLGKVKAKPRKHSQNSEDSNQTKRPRGRPRKNPLSESLQNMQPENSNKLLQIVATEETDKNSKSHKQQNNEDSNQTKRPRGRPRKNPLSESLQNMQPENSNKLLQIVATEETDKNSKSHKQQNNEDSNQTKRPRGRPRKNPLSESLQNMQPENSNKLLQIVATEETDKNSKSHKQQNKRGRPRKQPIKEPVNNSEFSDNSAPKTSQHLAVEFPEHSPDSLSVDKNSLFTPETVDKDLSQILPEDGSSGISHDQVTKNDYIFYTRKRKYGNKEDSTKSMLTSSKSKLTKCQIRKKCEAKGADLPGQSQHCASSLEQDPVIVGPFHDSSLISDDVALPRLVTGLAHNGRVAWDMKWRPSDSHHISKHRMGYLAVLLGNGALEVWEVPFPRVTKAIYSFSHEEGTDPRFLLLKPVFKCSMLKCGDRQRLPCGSSLLMVHLKRLDLCFASMQIPFLLGHLSGHHWPVILRVQIQLLLQGIMVDPFHPLWDVPVQSSINSVDWLPDPRCVVLSSDDGEIRFISLLKAACDTPVTGVPFVKTPQYGLHSYYCSSSPIWSAQVSRLTGMVAYCCSDGKVIHFKLTTKAVEKDPHRNREPHYLCGSLAEEESTLVVFSPLPNVPLPMKRSSKKCGDAPKSKRGTSNQEKRAKEEILKNQTLLKQPSESSSQTLVCVYNDVKSEQVNVKETLPSKMVAMHRVRCNMNKGSERLLCYGGAAGILRCQIIS